MAQRRRCLRFAGALLASLVPSALMGQGGGSLLNISFRLFSVGEADWNEIYYIKDATIHPNREPELQKLLFNYLDRSIDSYHYHGNNPLIFYRVENKGNNDKPILKPIASVHISPDMTKPLLFFSTSGGHFKNAVLSNDNTMNLEFDIIALEDSAKNFPEGHVVFLNTTSKPLYSQFGDEKLKLPPGITGPISVTQYIDKEIFVGMVIEWKNTAKIILKNHWRFFPHYRYIMLIKPPKQIGTRRISVLQIAEYVRENTEFNPNYEDPVLSDDI